MNDQVKLPPIATTDRVVGITDYFPLKRPNTNCTVSMSYINYLGYAVGVLDMNNILTTIPHMSSPSGEPVFLIEYRIGFTNDVNLNWDTLYNENSSNPTINALKNVMKDSKAKLSNIGNEFIIEYAIKHSTLTKNNFAVYYSDLNIVIAKADKAYNVVHPLSGIGQNLVVGLSENVTGFQYRVIINDPFNQFGERFININGAVFKVRRTVDHSIKPGVYVHSNDQCIDSGQYIAGIGNDYYPFESADEALSLYGSVHLAATLGDMNYKQTQEIKIQEGNVKEKLAELGLRKIQMETKLKDMEYKHKKDHLSMEAENTRLKDELDRVKQLREEENNRSKHTYEIQSREDKAYYERRAYERKDVNELMKWIPAVLTGVLTIATLLMKLTTAQAK